MLDSLDVGVAVVAPDWTIAEWTPSVTRFTGVPAGQALGKSLWLVFPSAKGSDVERLFHDVLSDGTPRSYLAPSHAPGAQGQAFETRVTRGPHHQLILLFRELGEELAPESRAAEILRAFEQDRRLYIQLFNGLPIPAILLSVDGQILEANPEGVALLGGADAAVLRGRRLADWVSEPQRPALGAALRDAVTRRQAFRLSVDFGGEPVREVDAIVENVEPGDGSPKLIFLAVDVSREVLLQRKLLQADRLSQLGTLLSGVAHELNNPLAAIAAFAEVLEVDAKSAELRETGEIIHQEAMRAGRVVQTLLDFARQRPRVRQAVDIKDVVARVIALHRAALKKARIQVVELIPNDIPAVMGDPQELQQVLLNGVVNAEQAIAATGQPGKVFISAQASAQHVLVTVEDTGPGVPPDALERVFDPFFTTKGEAGTGLGLAISYGLVKGMGGRIYIVNVEGGGARLSIELPADAPVVGAAPSSAVPGSNRALSVLIVDDEEMVRRGVARMAERLGHRVTSAASFADGLARLKGSHARFDAVIVDVHLDEAHTGFDLFEALRLDGRGRDRRLVFTTGDSMSAKTRDRLQLAGRPVLKKPFNLNELREMLERVGGEAGT